MRGLDRKKNSEGERERETQIEGRMDAARGKLFKVRSKGGELSA